MQPENNQPTDQTPTAAPAQEPVSQPAQEMGTPVAAPADTTNTPVAAPTETAMPTNPVAPAVSMSAEDPGKTLGVVSLVLAILGFNLISLILGLVAMNKSKKAGHKNTMALIGVVLSILSLIAFTALVAIGIVGGLSES